MPACCDDCENLYNVVRQWQGNLDNAKNQLKIAQDLKAASDAAVAADQQKLAGLQQQLAAAQAMLQQLQDLQAKAPGASTAAKLQSEQALVNQLTAQVQGTQSKLKADQNQADHDAFQVEFWNVQIQYDGMQLGWALARYSLCCQFCTLGFADPDGAAKFYIPYKIMDPHIPPLPKGALAPHESGGSKPPKKGPQKKQTG